MANKIEMPKFKYIAKSKMKEDWANLLLMADSDFVSVTILFHFDIQMSSALWLTCHSIEKYLKSIILRHKPSINLRSFNHNLLKLWKEVGKIHVEEELFHSKEWTEFIEELNINGNNPSLRYSGGTCIEEPTFSRAYTLLCTYLRLIVLGPEEFKKRDVFGIDQYHLNGGFTTYGGHPLIEVRTIVEDQIENLLKNVNIFES